MRTQRMTRSLPSAKPGDLRAGHTFNTSTMREASTPNWAPAGPDSARKGIKMAEARLPAMPDPR